MEWEIKIYLKEELQEEIRKETDGTIFLAHYYTFTPSYIDHVIAQVRNILSEQLATQLLEKITDQEILNIWSKYYQKVFTPIEATAEEIRFRW